MVIFNSYVKLPEGTYEKWVDFSMADDLRRPEDVGHPSGAAGRACRKDMWHRLVKGQGSIPKDPNGSICKVVTPMTYDASFYEFLSGKCCFLWLSIWEMTILIWITE